MLDRHLLCVVLLGSLSSPAWAQDAEPAPPADVAAPAPANGAGGDPFAPSGTPPGTPAPATGSTELFAGDGAPVLEVKELKRLILQRLDTMEVTDLRQKMARAQAVLGLEGQALLRDRATLRSEHERAQSILQRIEQDPLVRAADGLFANQAFQQQLRLALELPSETEQLNAIWQILQENQIADVALLKKVVHLRLARQHVALYERALAGVEQAFNQIEADRRTPGDDELFLASSVTELASRYAHRGGTESPTPASMPSGELKELLSSLLASEPQEEAPPTPAPEN